MGMDLHKISSRVIQVLGIQLAPTGARIFDIDAAPTDGTSGTGAGLAAKGSLLLRTDNGTTYINSGTKASPTWTALSTLQAAALGAAVATSLQASSFIKTSSPAATGGVGYSTGAGGTVTQITNRSTGVTMVPNPCMSGTIQTDTTSLAAEASADFVVTNSAVAIGDVVVVSIQSGAVAVGTIVSVSTVTNGSFTIRVHNGNAAAGVAETGAIIINFAIIKAVSA